MSGSGTTFISPDAGMDFTASGGLRSRAISRTTARSTLAAPSITGSATIHDVPDGTVTGTGTFSGTLINDGEVDPGDNGTVGTLAVGTYKQTQTGVLNVDIASAGSFDQISTTSSAALAGELDISLLNGYERRRRIHSRLSVVHRHREVRNPRRHGHRQHRSRWRV